MDHFQDLRSEMILTMEKLGIEIEIQHHEVGTAGQAEIDMRFRPRSGTAPRGSPGSRAGLRPSLSR